MVINIRQTKFCQADKNFQGIGQKFSTHAIVEKFCPRIKFYGRTFFLDRPAY